VNAKALIWRTKPLHGKDSPRDDREAAPRNGWNWVYFACGFFPIWLLVFFDMVMPFFPRFWPHVAETTIVATSTGTLTAVLGEGAFVKILRSLRWW